MQLWLVETRQEMKEMKRMQLWERSTLYSCTHARTTCAVYMRTYKGSTCVRTYTLIRTFDEENIR